MSKTKIAVIGAGLAGLTVAKQVRDASVDVYEATDRIGGKLRTVAFEGGPTDIGAESFIPTEDMRAFIEALGLTGSLVDPTDAPTLRWDGKELSLIDVPRTTTFRHGLQELPEKLAEESGADIYIDAFISGITRETGRESGKQGFRLKGGEDKLYDNVVLAVPAPTAALLLKQVDAGAAEALAKVKLTNSVVVGMRFATGEGLPEAAEVRIADGADGVRAAAFVFSSQRWPHLADRDGALVRATLNVEAHADEDDLVDWALDDLATVTGFDGRAAGLEEIYVQRWFGAFPEDTAANKAAAQEASELIAQIPGISATGAWVSGPGIPNVIAHARATADQVPTA